MSGSVERMLSPSRARERDLVIAFQAGDARAYDSIDHSCRPAAERICRRLLINPADVEEAVQETMVRAYQGLPRFNGSYALTAWVARIATNVCLDTLRARSRRPQNGGQIEPSMETPNGHETNGQHEDPEELVVKVFEAEEVRHVLAALPERHRTALVLREFEGYSHRKIAEMLDTSPERVKALIHRAKAGFRRAWKDDGPGRIAAFAPLLTPINWVRKVFGRAPEFDHPAAASAAQAASSPVTQSLVTVASERISTAVAAVMLAGTVGFAVQHAPRESRAVEQPIVVEAAQAVVEPQEAKPASEPKEKRESPKHDPEVVPSPVVEASPAAEELEEIVLAEPEEAGKPEVEGDPAAQAPPHPAGFSYSFTSDRTADEPCGCDGSSQLTQKSISVSDQGLSSYEGAIAGAISDSTGQPAWPVHLDVAATNNTIAFYFEVRTADGTSPYDASGSQASLSTEPWGGWTYSYTGTFQRRGGPPEHADAPRSGSFSVAMTFSWQEQRLVAATFGLTEAG